MLNARYFLAYSLLMTAVVVASNFLVQFPLQGTLAGINLADLLTFGAFTYPVAFLVTDLTNRQFGPTAARKVVFVGFIAGVVLSILLATPRIAVASGSAFLVGQLLDISVFNRLRRLAWWKAPLMGSVIGSVLDTVIFFSLSFAPVFGFIGPNDDFAIAAAPILGVMSAEAPRWISWAIADFSVKMLIGIVMLLPYGALMSVLRPMPQVERAA
ncbi:queuosine precursor transporter [Rhizobium glycinendophyticum]|uniref:Probable queuosine precursor transporter n=1 Tax=Rhizobium glycinendophyticum TaxID=2589807 RepID=A0A504U0I9_9HYPH|nr:queuosine precursor transporter [Rhizobium glycinendophyticum]TPP07007.1 queuosine precursor transporter [Rhizobium glycinendophyticum]